MLFDWFGDTIWLVKTLLFTGNLFFLQEKHESIWFIKVTSSLRATTSITKVHIFVKPVFKLDIIGTAIITGCGSSCKGGFTAMCGVWRQCSMPTLWSPNMWGLQRFFQKNRAEKCQICLPGGQKLPGRQKTKKSLPVLPISEMSHFRNGNYIWYMYNSLIHILVYS